MGLTRTPSRMVWLIWSTLFIWSTNANTEQIYQAHCRDALGMHSGAIKDSSVTASSSYDSRNVGPQNARIRQENYGGAWCPGVQINHNAHEWLEVDLGKVKKITLVETQGRFGNGQGQEFTEFYFLDYQRNDNDTTWRRYSSHKEKEMFSGNVNTYIAELREVNPPIIARRVRFIPYSRHPRTICMRVEMYGCDWKEGVVAYSMPQGDTRGTELDLADFTFDGSLVDGQLIGGLGQLIDEEEGYTNFRLDTHGINKKGYEWVGWRNESLTDPITIEFEFDHLRNFSSVRVFCNNMYQKSIRVFRSARLSFSQDGEHYSDQPVILPVLRDSLVEYARPVIIPIPYRLAIKVKLQLFFEARWMMISEVHFKSEIVNTTIPAVPARTPSTLPPYIATTTTSPNPLPAEDTWIEIPLSRSNKKDRTGTDRGSKGRGRERSKESDQGSKLEEDLPLTPDEAYILEIQDDLQEKMNQAFEQSTLLSWSDVQNEPQHNNSPNGGISPADLPPAETDESADKLAEEHIGIVIGALCALILILAAISIFIMCRNRRRRGKSGNSSFDAFEKQHMATIDNGQDFKYNNGMLGNYNMYNSIGRSSEREDDYDNDSVRKLKERLLMTQDADKLLEQDEPDTPPPLYVKLPPEPIYSNSTRNSPNTPPRPAPPTLPAPNMPPPPIPPHPHPAALTAALDFMPISETYSGGKAGRLGEIMEFPREQLKFVEKLGDGQFGEVHICTAHVVTDGQTYHDIPVAVKLLKASQNRDQFLHEARVLAGLRDPHMVQVLGVCTDAEPIIMIQEYTRYGDLSSLLRRTEAGQGISYSCQVYMATQISAAMKFFESENLVHRDLAARNCLVDENYAIKICDLGMSMNQYREDYYRVQDSPYTLPIRWMAWESVMLGKYSSKSDVWSFAVTLWEIFTLARQKPYADFTNEAVIENCSKFFHENQSVVVLSGPHTCPKEMYDLMLECWSREEAHRPSFRDIHMFLQRKNMGYQP